MSGETIDLTQPGTILRPFPSASDVFVPDQVDLVRHLHPLVSVDLSAANPEWSGWAHIVSPLEPADGYPFKYGCDFYGDFLRENALVLRLEDGRYRFPGDRRGFLLERDPDGLTQDDLEEYQYLSVHYKEAEASFRAAEAAFCKHGKLYSRWDLDAAGELNRKDAEPQPLVEQLGGTVGFGNWIVGFAYPFEPPYEHGDPEPDAIWPLSPSGRRFAFVASTPGWAYRNDGADSILLFYEPVEGLVLLTFDWT